MRDSRSSTRWAIGRLAFRYGKPWALMTTVGGLWLLVTVDPFALVAVNGTRTVSAFSGSVVSASVRTSAVRTVPDAVPAGNVSVPDAGV